MPVRKLKPITPRQRFRIVNEYSEITTSNPEKSLLKTIKKTGGRNNQGRMTMRYKGGGHKKRYRIIDFKRDKYELMLKFFLLNTIRLGQHLYHWLNTKTERKDTF